MKVRALPIKEATVKSESDRMLPIIEIIEKSIIKGDASTARFGLDEINGCYLRYLTEENEAYVSPYFLNHILGVGRAAIIAANDDSMLHVLRIFSEVGIHTVTKRMDRSTKMVLEDIGIIGFKVLKDYDAVTQQLADSLRGILRAIIGINNCNVEILTQIFALYRNASDELFTLKKDRMITYILNSFSGLLDLMVENKRYEVIGGTTELLERTGVRAVSFDVRDAIHQSVQSLHKIGISFAKDASVLDSQEVAVNIAESTIDHLLKIEGETLKYKSKSKEFEAIINEIEYAKKDIEKYLEKGVDFSDLWSV
jgi:RNA-binding protein YhbY